MKTPYLYSLTGISVLCLIYLLYSDMISVVSSTLLCLFLASFLLKALSHSSSVQTQTTFPPFSLSGHTLQIEATKLAKRQVLTQTEFPCSEQSSNTVKVDLIDRDIQTWEVAEDQSVGTTQSLLQPLLPEEEVKLEEEPIKLERTFTGEEGKSELPIETPVVLGRVRSNSEEFLRQEMLNEKEFVLNDLGCEARDGTYQYFCMVEAETPILREMFNHLNNKPIFIGLVNFAEEDTGDINYGVFKEFFLSDERFIKLRSIIYGGNQENGYLANHSFQQLFACLMTSSLSNAMILIVKDEFSSVLVHYFRYLFRTVARKKELYILHNTNNLDASVRNFNENLGETLDEEITAEKERNYYIDKEHGIYHLLANEYDSFNSIESKVILSQRLNFDPANSCFINPSKQFSFEESFEEAFVNTLAYLLIPVFQKNLPQFESSCKAEEYGYTLSAGYKMQQGMPKAILFESKPPQTIHISPLALYENKLFSTLHSNTKKYTFSSKPVCCLFLSMNELDYESIFSNQPFRIELIDLFPTEPSVQSELNNLDFDVLSSWVIGCSLCDFIIMKIDFTNSSELQHSDLLFKFFSTLKNIEKPLILLHDAGNYENSLHRTSLLIEQTEAFGCMRIDEHFYNDPAKDRETIEGIKEQMMDNLYQEFKFCDFSKNFNESVETVIQNQLVVYNSRQREILVTCEEYTSPAGICVGATLEPTWNCTLKEELNKNLLRSRVYVSPVIFNIDQDFRCRSFSNTFTGNGTELVKVGILTNMYPESLSYPILEHIEHCFSQLSEEVLLVLPSSMNYSHSPTNRINSAPFDALTQDLLIEKVSDCIMLILEYSPDMSLQRLNLPAIGKMLNSHFKKEGQKKPIMVFHHIKGYSDSAEVYSQFLQAIDSFSEVVSTWGGIAQSRDLSTHQHTSEGVYAFDKENQIIHRALVLDGPINWAWYNSILYKIMHNACLKQGTTPLRDKLTRAFGDCIRDTLRISEGDETIIPIVKSVKERESSLCEVFSFSLAVPVQAAWAIELIE